jgi:hypothetical protein
MGTAARTPADVSWAVLRLGCLPPPSWLSSSCTRCFSAARSPSSRLLLPPSAPACLAAASCNSSQIHWCCHRQKTCNANTLELPCGPVWCTVATSLQLSPA